MKLNVVLADLVILENNKRHTMGFINRLKVALGLLIFFAAIVSCRSTKKIQASIIKRDTTVVVAPRNKSADDSLANIQKALTGLKSREIDFKTFSAKVKVEYQDVNGKKPNITAYIRIQKDSLIWISGYATVFNVEAFRVLITQDSVFVLDKLNKEVQMRSLDYLQEVTKIPFDFNTLQNLLVGNPIFFSDSVVSYKENESSILMSTLGDHFKHLLTIQKSTGNLLHSKLDDINLARNRTADITYDEFEKADTINFPTYREITVSEKNKLDIQMNYKQYEFNKELQINFTIPKNYKRL